MFRYLLMLFYLIDVLSGQDIRMPPDITLGPKNEKQFRDGDTIRLDCVSNGQPKPWFEWKKDDKLVDPNDNSIRWVQPEVTGTIEILQANKARTGYYQCLAKNSHGTAMSNVSFVQMAWLDRFPVTGIQPYHKTEGEDLVLPCQNLNSVPSPPTFSWALATSTDDKHPSAYIESDRVRIDDFGNLHFAFVKKEDEYNNKLYKCHVFNPVLDITQGGSYANLSITAVSPPIPTSSPRLAFQTVSPLIGLVGESVDMTCLYYGSPVPKVTWKKSSGSLPPASRWKLDPYGSKAHIDKLEKGDAGDYICTGTSSGVVSNSTITLQIEAKPTFIIGPNHLSSKNATEGDSLTFTCASNATPAANTIWYRNRVNLEPNNLPHKYRLSADGLNLTISDLCKNCPDHTSDLVVIQCNASNVHGYVFAQGSVNVIVKTIITSTPGEVLWMPNTEVVFPCVVTSDDLTPFSRNWFFNNQPLVNDSSIYFDQGQRSLYIKTANDVSEDQRLLGTYKCIVTNGYSNATVEHRLTETIVVQQGAALWWIPIVIAIILLIIIIILLICFFIRRNKGDSYSVDEKERKTGNDPEEELNRTGFQNYQRGVGSVANLDKSSKTSLANITYGDDSNLENKNLNYDDDDLDE